jgi:murein L,D-transpeptidase YcbB/YkuD
VLLQVYGWKLQGGGCTSQWNTASNWKAKGKISDGIPKDTLVCLFYSKNNKEKTWEHTGFGLNNETVECSSGVQYFTSRNKKWTHWAVPACEEGDVPVPTPTPTPSNPTLKKGSSGQYVTLLQTELINRGYSCGKSGADGKFGNNTLASVKAFQKDHGLTADGIVGPQTWNALDNAEPTVYYTVTIPHLTQAAANQLLTNYPGGSMTKE